MTGAPYGRWSPWNAAADGVQVDQLISIIHWFMLVLFVGWGIFFVYCLLRFRSRAGHQASYALPAGKMSKYAEIGVAIFETVLLVGFSIPVWWRYKYDPPKPDRRQEVRAVGEQFAWNFHYPGPDGKFGRTDPHLITASNLLGVDFDNDPVAKDDVVSPTMHVRKELPVYVRISSKDVIHSFYIPAMRVKQDAVPGMEVPVWFTPIRDSDEFRAAIAKDYPLNERFKEKMLRTTMVSMQKYEKGGETIAESGQVISDEIVEKLKTAGTTTVRAAEQDPIQVVCAQLCGANHFKMKAPMSVDTEAQYEAWLKELTTEPQLDLE